MQAHLSPGRDNARASPAADSTEAARAPACQPGQPPQPGFASARAVGGARVSDNPSITHTTAQQQAGGSRQTRRVFWLGRRQVRPLCALRWPLFSCSHMPRISTGSTPPPPPHTHSQTQTPALRHDALITPALQAAAPAAAASDTPRPQGRFCASASVAPRPAGAMRTRQSPPRAAAAPAAAVCEC